jgi:hypothetical protein
MHVMRHHQPADNQILIETVLKTGAGANAQILSFCGADQTWNWVTALGYHTARSFGSPMLHNRDTICMHYTDVNVK